MTQISVVTLTSSLPASLHESAQAADRLRSDIRGSMSRRRMPRGGQGACAWCPPTSTLPALPGGTSCLPETPVVTLNGASPTERPGSQQELGVSYYMNTVMGESITAPDEATIREILAGSEKADDEHPDVALAHESGWSLSVFADKTLLWENIEGYDNPPREKTLDSWQAVVDVLLNSPEEISKPSTPLVCRPADHRNVDAGTSLSKQNPSGPNRLVSRRLHPARLSVRTP